MNPTLVTLNEHFIQFQHDNVQVTINFIQYDSVMKTIYQYLKVNRIGTFYLKDDIILCIEKHEIILHTPTKKMYCSKQQVFQQLNQYYYEENKTLCDYFCMFLFLILLISCFFKIIIH